MRDEHIPISHGEHNHSVPQTCTNKNIFLIFKAPSCQQRQHGFQNPNKTEKVYWESKTRSNYGVKQGKRPELLSMVSTVKIIPW